jgi:nucleotide-binding universal stress UspA family protein
VSGKELDEMITLPNRILLATDGSEDAARAARVAADLAERAGAELHVVHAWQADPPKAYAVTVSNTSVRWCEQQAGKLLDRQVEQIERAGGAVAEGHLLRGEPVEKITELAEDLDVDLVVVGRRGLGTARRLTTGSVSEGVVRDASCPVLVVRGEEAAWPPARVVVGEDFSEDSKAAARLAASIGRLYGARTILVHAYPLLELGSKVPVSGVFRINGEVRTARGTLELLAREIEEEVGETPEARVAIGAPANCILEAATESAEPTLVVVGSRGLGVLERFRVGSVSTRVMREAEGPVLVYRRS